MYLTKFVAKLLNTGYCLNDIPTFLGLDYGGASLIILYYVVQGFRIPKIRQTGWLYHIKNLNRT